MPGVFFVNRDPKVKSIPIPVTIEELNELVVPSTIHFVYMPNDKEIELKTSDYFHIQIQGTEQDCALYIYGGGKPANRIKFSNVGSYPTAHEIEQRIFATRQLYATIVLVNAGRSSEITSDLADNGIDIEQKLLKKEDHLELAAVSIGSVWITLNSWLKDGQKSIGTVVAMFSDAGRELLLRRLQAKTVSEELDVEKKASDFKMERLNKIVDFVQKVEEIEDSGIRKTVKDILSKHASTLDVDAEKLLNFKTEEKDISEKTSDKKESHNVTSSTIDQDSPKKSSRHKSKKPGETSARRR